MFSKLAWAQRFAPCAVAAFLVGASSFGAAHAQTNSMSVSSDITVPSQGATPLARLFEAAWERAPAANAQAARRAAAQAQRDSAARLTPEPASVAVAHRTDQPTRNEGQREVEVELAVPLWLPGQRRATMQLGEADAQLAELAIQLDRLKLANEIRQRWWGLVLAANTLALERRRMADAQQLAADVQRRLKAGEIARTDSNQAQALVQLAQAAQTEAEQALDAQVAELRVLTGVPDAVLLQLATGEPLPEQPAARGAQDEHPELAAARLTQAAAQAKLRLAAASARANPSVSLGVIRERGSFGEAQKNTLRLGVSVPLSSGPTSLAQTETARAQALEAEATLPLLSARLQAQERVARAALDRARSTLLAAELRVALHRDTSVLLDRAYRLGEIDITTRLRAASDLFEAQRSLLQARAQLARAQSELNQSLGLLP